ncbi:16S rRNA (guanine(527)-N(7))-methyltransferase RsmG [Phnomibacter sp. MR]|uniref:16S rRNA (guanine(527)-N(7))-methyltransferase RsmG n=1 Tax=Phnomibacter sp. MR TaxID=3042318 RepID=UPI003A80F721
MNLSILTKYFADFTPTQLQQLQALEGLYKEWNEKINVISRKDIDSLYLKHVLHSLSIAAIFDFQPGMQVIDIGAGGGFPSVPLAIFYPEVQFHAVDSINKKLTVINEVAAGAGIPNITTQHTRAEQITNRKFDVAVSRAVAPLKDLLQWSKHLLNKPSEVRKRFGAEASEDMEIPAGLICLKGGDLAQEIHDSGRKPFIWPINEIFPEEFFGEKFVLQVK